jgi:proteic killer suppression protein
LEIRSFLDKRLERLYSKNDRKGFSPEVIDKLRKMLDFLEAMQDPEELRSLPTWKAHRLTGNRKGSWALHVTRNWRLTFRIDTQEQAIKDMDYEDYH